MNNLKGEMPAIPSQLSFLRPQYLIVLLFLPIFFISIQRTHDWGGDFSMYIQHAQNIVEGKPYAHSGYIYNDKRPYLSPKAYPPGHPLILSPVIAFFGNNLGALKFWMNVLLFFTAIFMFGFYKNNFNTFISILLTLLIIYNPWTLEYKGAILSEIPFAMVFLAAVLYYQRNTVKAFWHFIVIGILAAILMCIRPIGIIFILGIVFDQLTLFIKRRSISKKKTYHILSFIGTSLILYFLLTNVFFPLPEDQFLYFSELFVSEGIYGTVLSNLNYNLELLGGFFVMHAGDWEFLHLILKSVVIVLSILGIMKMIGKGMHLLEWITVLYISILLFWPVQTQGFRYLFPIYPFLLYYMVKGLEAIQLKKQFSLSYKMLALFILAVVFYPSGYNEVSERQSKAPPGPYEESAQQTWSFIQQNTAPGSRIAFFKPRVLALFTGRNSMATLTHSTPSEIHQNLLKQEMDYLLLHKSFIDQSLKTYAAQLGDQNLIWENEDFQCYTINEFNK